MLILHKKTVGIFISLGVAIVGFLLSYLAADVGFVNAAILAMLLCLVSLFVSDMFVKESAEALVGDFKQTVLFGLGFYAKMASERISRMKREYDLLVSGVIEIGSLEECLRTYCRFLEQAEARGNLLLATSMVSPREVWTDAVRSSNFEFLSRGGKIERIFILSNEINDTEIATTLREMEIQKNGGIKVLQCSIKDLSPDIRKDFIIYQKGRVALEFNVAEGIAWAGQLTKQEIYVYRLLDIYSKIRIHSTEFKGAKGR